jgi:hypothetical protein
MIRQDININGYWKIIVIYDAPLGRKDVGFTYTNPNKKTSIVGISSTSSQEQFINTIIHEAKHVQSHICEYYEVPEDGEQAAYLIGYIVQKMHRVFRNMISTGVK